MGLVAIFTHSLVRCLLFWAAWKIIIDLYVTIYTRISGSLLNRLHTALPTEISLLRRTKLRSQYRLGIFYPLDSPLYRGLDVCVLELGASSIAARAPFNFSDAVCAASKSFRAS